MSEDNSIIGRARRARPTTNVPINGETFAIRMPCVAAMREFQKLQAEGDSDGAVSAIIRESVIDDQGVASLTEADARELVNSPWIASALTTAIFALSGITPGSKPDAGGGSAVAAPVAEGEKKA